MDDAETKYAALVEGLGALDGVVVAFSGGVDSSLLLAAAVQALGPRALAVTAQSPSSPPGELEDARRVVALLGARHRTVQTDELALPEYRENPPDRCYYCKNELFGQMKDLCRGAGLEVVVEGSNADDLSDHRPGMRSLAELEIRSPLVEVGLTKAEIRLLARRLELPVWDKPSLACLASRVPYGLPITAEKLGRIGAAEAHLRGLGFGQLRVRDHEAVARVELLPEDFARLLDDDLRLAVTARLKELGYSYVALDLQGYRTGALNEVLPET